MELTKIFYWCLIQNAHLWLIFLLNICHCNSVLAFKSKKRLHCFTKLYVFHKRKFPKLMSKTQASFANEAPERAKVAVSMYQYYLLNNVYKNVWKWACLNLKTKQSLSLSRFMIIFVDPSNRQIFRYSGLDLNHAALSPLFWIQRNFLKSCVFTLLPLFLPQHKSRSEKVQ
jgi:hypothetical protein